MKKFTVLFLTVVMAVIACFGLTACGEKVQGFDIEIINQAKSYGFSKVKIEYKKIDWDKKEEELNNKTVDIICSGLTYNLNRLLTMSLTHPYLKSSQVAIIRIDDYEDYTENADFLGKKGCAEAKSTGVNVCKNVLIASCEELSSVDEIFEKVASSQFDFGVVDSTVANAYIKKEASSYSKKLCIFKIENVAEEGFCFGFRKGSNLADVFNFSLAKLFKTDYKDGFAFPYYISSSYGLQENVDGRNFKNIDTDNFKYPVDGDYVDVLNKGVLVVGYTVSKPLAYN